MEFSAFGLSEAVAASLQRQGFTEPTPIQERSIPPLLQGRDIMAKAETGSGKTLAFGIPLIERVEANRVSIQALVICPTRELAQQVAEDLQKTGEEKGVRVALVVGGVHVRTQRMQIPGRQVVVGTPGRILDLLEDRFLPVEWVEYLVLDEFDRLLDMGFLDDVKRIIKRLPDERQTALLSATTPKEIMRHAMALLRNPVEIETTSGISTVATVEQRAIRTKSSRKLTVLEKLLRETTANDGTVIVFCNTKRQVRQVDRELWAKDFSVAALSGDHEQSVRFKVMERFRNREIRVLVATDVAARGLDIDHIEHVINFDVPFEVEDYVHRIGRTARAGRDGVVTTLVGDEDFQSFQRIRRDLDQAIEMVPERATSRSRKPKTTAKPRDAEHEPVGAEPVGAEAGAEQEQAAPEQQPPPASTRRDEGRQDKRDDGDGRPPGRGRRGRRRGRSTSDESSETGASPTEAREAGSSESDGGSRRGGGRRRRGERERGGRGEQEKGESGRGRRGRGDRGGSSPDRDRPAKPARAAQDSREAESDDTAARNGGPSRKRRGGRERDGAGNNGRRSRVNYKRWEEEQLNKPVELIADNWDSVDEIDSIGSGSGAAAERDRRSGDEGKGSSSNGSGRQRKGGGRRGQSARSGERRSGRKGEKKSGRSDRQKSGERSEDKPVTSKASGDGRPRRRRRGGRRGGSDADSSRKPGSEGGEREGPSPDIVW